MYFLKLAMALSLILGLIISPAWAGQQASDRALGVKLLQQIWSDMKKPGIANLEKTIANGFQSVHQYGANNREQEIELIKSLQLGEYSLSDIKITRNGPVIVTTYFVSVEETIKGKRLQKEPSPRLSVFQETDDGWKWIAHANLAPLR